FSVSFDDWLCTYLKHKILLPLTRAFI
ncbi:Hypothetical protein EIN_060350, partial [Entamoeba invadens IP1]